MKGDINPNCQPGTGCRACPKLAAQKGTAMKRPLGDGGNGSSKFDISAHDMAGWVRVLAGKTGTIPEDLPAYLSRHLTNWFRQRPHLRSRCVLPVNKDGNTVELHAWYDQVLFNDLTTQEQQDG